MRLSIVFRVTVAAIFFAGSAFGKENPEATAKYGKAVEQLKAGNRNVDFKALRMNCAVSKHRCEADPNERKAVVAFLNEKRFEDALKAANKVIDEAFVDIDMHYLAFIAGMEMKKEDEAEFHKFIIRGLLDSIQENKHGRSEEDAFEVINVHEEYVFLRFSKMAVNSQSLVHKNGHSFDVMKCTDTENKREITVYFNIDIPMKRLREAIQ